MPKPIDALDYLAAADKHPSRPICVLFGDEPFLKREALAALRERILGSGEGDFSFTAFEGDDVEWRDVIDEVGAVAMFGGGQRLVVIEEADDFVSHNRSSLEDYVARPRSTATLVLEVSSWPATTRLYKSLAESGLQIECKGLSAARLLKWLATRARETHGVKLEGDAAEALVEAVEPELGLLDQELAKLALLAGEKKTITPELVGQAVGAWRTRTTWDMLDAAVEGNASGAFTQLDRLLLAGEAPVAIMGQIASTLRRFAAATRIIEEAEATRRRIPLREALEQAGFKSFILGKAEGQLRQLGRKRGGKLYRWLLDADLALKGASSSPARARLVLEQLIARLSRAAAQEGAAS